MSGADEGENSGLRIGPHTPDSGSEASDGSAEDVVTQLLPMVNPGPPSEEPPVVRAIARRAAAALPALGREDGAVEVSKSARAAIDRHKRANAAAGARPDPPAQPAQPDVVEPPVVAEPPAADPVVIESGALAEQPSGLTPAFIAFRDASTDEWFLPDDLQPSLATPDPATPDPRELMRPGPPLLASDSWDAALDADSHNEAYQGRRRAEAPALRIWVVIGLVLVGLGSAVAIPFALRSAPPAVAAPTDAASVAARPVIVSTDGEAISGTSSPAASPTRSPSPKPVVPHPSKRPSPTPSPTPPPTPPPFAPLPMEAEAATRGGSAAPRAVSGASNGTVVGGLGDRGDPENDGWLRLTVSVPSAGQYKLAVYYTFSTEADRDAYVSVNGGQPSTHNFLPSPACPCASKSITVTLAAGANTIEFGNPVEPAPSIDKIVITRP